MKVNYFLPKNNKKKSNYKMSGAVLPHPDKKEPPPLCVLHKGGGPQAALPRDYLVP